MKRFKGGVVGSRWSLTNIDTKSIYFFVKTAKLFKTGGSQAVRLPKECRFEGEEVHYRKVGPALVLLPRKGSWDILFEACGEFSPGFMEPRKQPKLESREPIRS